MGKLKSFLNGRSSEVLVTLMIRDINRFLGEEDRAESYRKFFGRPGVLEKLRNTQPEDRAEQAVFEYSQSLKELCGFKYVSAAVVLEPNRVMALLAANTEPTGVEYKELFCEAMFFPLVTPNDLVEWIKMLEPNIEVQLAGAASRKKPKPSENFRVVVINPKVLK